MALHFCLDPKNGRINLTTRQKSNPLVAPNFCMLLRKHLLGARLLEINTFGLERACEFVFESRNELQDRTIRKVIVEIMSSHSNLILTNENGSIIDALKHVFSEEREILPARKYTLPRSNKHNFLFIQNFSEFLGELSPIDNSLCIDKQISDCFSGISRSFINHLLTKLELPSTNLSNSSLEKIYNSIKEIVDNIFAKKIILQKNGSDYFPELSVPCDNFANNFFLDDFYFEKEANEAFIAKRNNLLVSIQSVLKKYTKRLENISLKLKECTNMDIYRLYGELITSNLYRFKNENLDSVIVQNYYDENREITIPLDKRFSFSKNAALFFKKYNKLKNTLEVVSRQKKETELELDYLESVLFSVENSKIYSDLEEIETEMLESDIFKTNRKKVFNKKQPKDDCNAQPLKFEFEGFTIFAGKNNKQNDTLTLKIANRNDLWFHTQKIQGSHVILKVEGKNVTDEVINYCAKIAKENSKAKNSTNVPVDYCQVKQIKKPSGSKPGMVIYREFKTIIVK